MNGDHQPRQMRGVLVGLGMSVAFWVVGMIVWPGCVPVPLPPEHAAIAGRSKKEVVTVGKERLTRAEMMARAGRPDGWFPDLRVACYRVDAVRSRTLWLLLFVIPVMDARDGSSVVFIEFDENDRAKRWAARRVNERWDYAEKHLHADAERWLAGK